MSVIVKVCRTNMFTVLVISAAGKRWLLLRNIDIGSKACIWIILVTAGDQRDFQFKVNKTFLMQVHIHIVSYNIIFCNLSKQTFL